MPSAGATLLNLPDRIEPRWLIADSAVAACGSRPLDMEGAVLKAHDPRHALRNVPSWHTAIQAQPSWLTVAYGEMVDS